MSFTNYYSAGARRALMGAMRKPKGRNYRPTGRRFEQHVRKPFHDRMMQGALGGMPRRGVKYDALDHQSIQREYDSGVHAARLSALQYSREVAQLRATSKQRPEQLYLDRGHTRRN